MKYDDGDWKELRARVDSLAGAIFLISGGALTLSISVLLKLKDSTPAIKCYASDISLSWYALLTSIILFVTLKVLLITQLFMSGFMHSKRYNPTVKVTNTFAWLLAILGLFSFSWGMFKLVAVATAIANV